ncbi:hypothetical protein E2C01_071582 [Portunus trituberculatus]|uniref:Uncharacterized protein n=1 Tax=Portunus trituberculatus TaxID=210409 RepID=A0A5B7I5A8_PORTR|nr:hypothetical protein [Portunus trituberculatus]
MSPHLQLPTPSLHYTTNSLQCRPPPHLCLTPVPAGQCQVYIRLSCARDGNLRTWSPTSLQ